MMSVFQYNAKNKLTIILGGGGGWLAKSLPADLPIVLYSILEAVAVDGDAGFGIRILCARFTPADGGVGGGGVEVWPAEEELTFGLAESEDEFPIAEGGMYKLGSFGGGLGLEGFEPLLFIPGGLGARDGFPKFDVLDAVTSFACCGVYIYKKT